MPRNDLRANRHVEKGTSLGTGKKNNIRTICLTSSAILVYNTRLLIWIGIQHRDRSNPYPKHHLNTDRLARREKMSVKKIVIEINHINYYFVSDADRRAARRLYYDENRIVVLCFCSREYSDN